VNVSGRAQVTLEVLARLDRLHASFERPHKVAHPLVALLLPLILVLNTTQWATTLVAHLVCAYFL
jgi:hypothetical protein